MNFQSISSDKVESYWNLRPCNIKHSKSTEGTKKYFAEVEKRRYFVEPHILKFVQFKQWQGKCVLEIGCGIGTDTINFARNGARVIAIDISKRSIVLAIKNAKINHVDNRIRFIHGNAENLSQYISKQKFDLIYSFGVIHHTPCPQNIINEIKKYTHKNTILKIMLYHRYSWKILWILLKYGKGVFWKLNDLIPKYSEAAFGSPITYVYSIKEVIELFQGLKILDIRIDHIFSYNIHDYIHYQYKKVWYFRYLPNSVFNLLKKYFGWHILITAKPY